MASKSSVPYCLRGVHHQHPVMRKLFQIAERKRSNLIISADFTTTDSLLKCADELGPYIAVFKTHIDIVRDFGENTVHGLKARAAKHDFLIFEDRKFADIGSTAQKQYHEGALRISEWADIVDALENLITAEDFLYRGQRALLLLAEMTTAGSLAVGHYTERCVEIARSKTSAVIGYVATRRLEDANAGNSEDFVIFTTGVNRNQGGNAHGQQYQTPREALEGGSDFIIVGRGIYASSDPVKMAKIYQKKGWEAYEARVADYR